MSQSTPTRYENEKNLGSTKNIKNSYKNQTQVFIASLPAPFLAGQPRFGFRSTIVISLIISLAIDSVVLMTLEIIVSISG